MNNITFIASWILIIISVVKFLKQQQMKGNILSTKINHFNVLTWHSLGIFGYNLKIGICAQINPCNQCRRLCGIAVTHK